MLESAGIADVRDAHDGRDALQCLGEANADVMVCDLNMPGMDGIELLRHVAECPSPPALIVLSGEDQQILQMAGRLAARHQLRTLGTLQKPPHREVVIRLLQRFVAQPEPERQAHQEPLSVEEVRAGIGEGRVRPWFQPIVSLADGSLCGVETLARWCHDDRGLLAPGAFIPVAEAHGLMDDLTRAILEACLVDVVKWRRQGLETRVSVNVSVDNLTHPDFPDYVAKQAIEAGLSLDRVAVEVTETKIMTDIAMSMEVLTRLRMKRVGIHIDDFGTGASSMEQLRQVPCTELKLDRAFVTGASQDANVRSFLEICLDLARRLGLSTIAEGVETQADWDLLVELGCDAAQGYHIARPMPGEQLSAWIHDWDQSLAN